MQPASPFPVGLRALAARHGSTLLPALALALVLGSAAIPGCAVYDDTWEGDCLTDCEPPGVTTGGECARPTDCDANETCGEDAACHPGNCRYWGCVDGYACLVTDRGTAECTLGADPTGTGGQDGTGGGDGGQGGGSGGGAGGPATTGTGGGGTGGGDPGVLCGNPDDCPEGWTCGGEGLCKRGACSVFGCIDGFVCDDTDGCVHQNAAGCAEDADCTGGAAGTRCVSGLCTPPEEQCFDGVQCPGGSSCADGKCIPTCAGGTPCPESWECDVALDVCSIPAAACAITADCGEASLVCVGGACVPRADGVTCPPGDVWVENGCLPEQRATFACTIEGEQAECANGLVCVHRTCFVPCAPPDEAVCAGIPGFEVCKAVPSETGTFAVCGAEESLGGECDPTLGVACDEDLACIDGSCR